MLESPPKENKPLHKEHKETLTKSAKEKNKASVREHRDPVTTVLLRVRSPRALRETKG